MERGRGWHNLTSDTKTRSAASQAFIFENSLYEPNVNTFCTFPGAAYNSFAH